jgi:hypothetical protein
VLAPQAMREIKPSGASAHRAPGSRPAVHRACAWRSHPPAPLLVDGVCWRLMHTGVGHLPLMIRGRYAHEHVNVGLGLSLLAIGAAGGSGSPMGSAGQPDTSPCTAVLAGCQPMRCCACRMPAHALLCLPNTSPCAAVLAGYQPMRCCACRMPAHALLCLLLLSTAHALLHLRVTTSRGTASRCSESHRGQ